MAGYKNLFKQTFIYGLATVLPRALSIILVPLYVSNLEKSDYGIYASLFAFIIFGNVILSYGMETTYFRFLHRSDENPKKVESTALTSLTITSVIFLLLTLPNVDYIARLLEFNPEYIRYTIWILALDAFVVIPFAWYRAREKPMRYAALRIANVFINLSLNLFFFLALPKLANTSEGFWSAIYNPDNLIAYVFISNIVASAVTLAFVSPLYFKIGFSLDKAIWKRMIRYAMPILLAGIAFSINEALDKILLKYLLPPDIADAEVGVYAACYKLGVFMTLFATAFRLGVEPFFFKQAEEKNAPIVYATVTKYFTLLGSLLFLAVMVYIDIFKVILITDKSYWIAMDIVPIILLANLFLGIYHNLSVWYKITDNTKVGAYISIVGALLTIVGNYLLIPHLSYYGSALATLLAYGGMMLLSYLFGQKYYPIPYPKKEVLMYLLLSTAFSFLAFYIFEGSLLIGTFLLVLYAGLLVYMERNLLLQLIKR